MGNAHSSVDLPPSSEPPTSSRDPRAGSDATPSRPSSSRRAADAILYRFAFDAYEICDGSVQPTLVDDGAREDAPRWMLEASDDVRVHVSDHLRLVSNARERRVDFLAPREEIVYALRWRGDDADATYRAFVSRYKDALFENRHGVRSTEENRAAVFGDVYASWASGEDHPDAVWDAQEEAAPTEEEEVILLNDDDDDDDDDDAQLCVENDENVENADPRRRGHARSSPLSATPERKTRASPAFSASNARLVRMGALDNSFLVRDDAVEVFRNTADGALTAAGVSVSLKNLNITPTKAILADAERTILLLSPLEGAPGGRSDRVYQMDLETEKIVREWSCVKDGASAPMLDVACDTKSAQLEGGRGTLVGVDANRLVRWDARVGGDARSVVQETTFERGASASPLRYVSGHDFARGAKFSCVATTGDGDVVVGADDGKIRLYAAGGGFRQAKTSFAGLGGAITAIDVTYDGKWVLATTDTCLVLLHTCFRDDRTGELTNGFKRRAGEKIAAPRLLKLKPEDVARMGQGAGIAAKFTRGKFTWVTERGGAPERWIVASCGVHSVVYNFRKVKAATAPGDGRLLECAEYELVRKDANVVESAFAHEKFTRGTSKQHLVIATTRGVV